MTFTRLRGDDTFGLLSLPSLESMDGNQLMMVFEKFNDDFWCGSLRGADARAANRTGSDSF